MKIDVAFDTVCPWCYVGKRRLDKALAQRPDVPYEICWRSFILDPAMPATGMARFPYLERRFGGPARVDRFLNTLDEAGAREGVAFNFPAMKIMPNSLHSHRLVHWAGRQGRADCMVESLFAAFFKHGRNIGSRSVLANIAAETGLDERDAATFLESDEAIGDVINDNVRTRRLTINGVPCVIFDGVYGIEGAQETEIIVRMIDLTLERRNRDQITQFSSMPVTSRNIY